MFIHRNIANLVNPDDLNLMSVLQYAVDVLEVRQHHRLSAITAAAGSRRRWRAALTGPVDRWLDGARAVLADHRDEIDAQPTEEAKVNRLVEVNVRDQLAELARTDTVQAAFARGAGAAAPRLGLRHPRRIAQTADGDHRRIGPRRDRTARKGVVSERSAAGGGAKVT